MVGSNYLIKMAMLETGTKSGYLADQLGMERQAFYNKLHRDTMSVKDVGEVLAVMGYELTIKKIDG